MQITKNGIAITSCDVCGDPLTFSRVGGYQTYEQFGFSVCSGCCAKPLTADSIDKKMVQFFITFYKRSKALDVVPPFWPINESGTKMDIKLLRAMA
ncbi:MAG: hypothetical protein U9Q12_00195 [Patescibacteria group bacterium]|nr:hypothetical protein [Patescibacteria group bacterium]